MFQIMSVTITLAAVVALLPLAGRVHATRVKAAAAEDARVAAGPAALTNTKQERRCPRCGGQHCWAWLHHGTPCEPQRAPRLGDVLLGPGLHEPTAAYRRIVPYGWRPPRVAWSTLTERIGALPRVGVLP